MASAYGFLGGLLEQAKKAQESENSELDLVADLFYRQYDILYRLTTQMLATKNVEAQYQMLAHLTRALRRRYPIRDIVGHCDIAPRRKTDPGPAFDWPLYRQMISPRHRAASPPA